MIKAKFLFLTLLAGVGVAVFISGCKKDSVSQPLEPISLIAPDSPAIRLFAGDSTKLDIKFTTDRPINWILGKYDIDSLIDSNVYVPTYPDTAFFVDLTKEDPRVNIYEYVGSYRVPDTLRAFSVIRFKVTYQAGTTVPIHDQNYPLGLTTAEKDFLINVR